MSVRKKSKPNGNGSYPSRVSPRFATLSEISVTYEGHNQVVVTRPPDLSIHGMFINTPHTFPEGAVLNVRFRLNRSRVEVSVRAEVRYCLPGVGVGVEFIEISPAAVRAIKQETVSAS